MFSNTGSRNVTDGGGPVVTHAAVELIFWGSGWNTGGGPNYRTQITNSVQTIMDSAYLSGLSQYRGIGNGSLLRTDTIASTSPGSTFTDGQVRTFVQSNINNFTLPGPATSGGQIVYMVVPQPGSTAVDPPGAIGAHSAELSFLGPFHYGWTQNLNTNYLDSVTTIFSHELTEIVTDPEPGVHSAFYIAPDRTDEICDQEAQNYTYRLGGVLVQACLSQATHSYNVYTGQTQNFIVSSTRMLTVNGDQLPSHNDTIIIDASGGGVLVTLNGEAARFDPGTISSITVNSGDGNDTIYVYQILAGVPVTINSSGAATINIGATSSVQSIQGPVTIYNGPNYDTVNLYDSGDTGNRNISISSGGITGLAPAPINFTSASVSNLTINGGSGTNTYTVAGTPAHQITLNTGSGTDTVNVQTITVPLAVNGGGGGGHDVVNLGLNNSLLGITGPVTIFNGPSYFQVNVNDSADTYNHANVVLTNSSLTGLAPVPINFGGASVNALTLNGGSGNNTYTVNGPQGSLGDTLNVGTGSDTVNLQATSVPLSVNGNGGGGNDVLDLGLNNSLVGITGAVYIYNGPSYFHVNINDSADTTNHTNVVLTGSSLTGLAPATIYIIGVSVNFLTINCGSGNNTYTVNGSQGDRGYLDVTLNTGSGTDTVNVQATRVGVPLTVNGGGLGNDVVNLGLNNSLANLLGAVTIYNGPSYFHVNVNDSADTTNHSNLVLTYGSLTGLAPAAINFGVASINALTINGGSGNNTYTVNGPQGFLGDTLNTGNGSDLVYVEATSVATTVNAGAGGNIFRISPFTQYLAASILGPSLTLNGGGGDILEFFDANDPNVEGFNFDAVPMSLTLDSTGTDLTDFFGMGGGVYVVTNGFSNENDASGTVIFDPSGGPPSLPGGGAPVVSGSLRPLAADQSAATIGTDAAVKEAAETGPVTGVFWEGSKAELMPSTVPARSPVTRIRPATPLLTPSSGTLTIP
jgi:hypothetical protein